MALALKISVIVCAHNEARQALRSNVDIALTLYRDGSWAA